MTLDKMLAIAKQTNDLNPDVIFLTGDFMSRVLPTTPSDITRSVQAFQAPEGIFAILGNHDYWTDAAAVLHPVRPAGNTQHLRNDHAHLQSGDATLHGAGVDEIYERKAALK